MSNDNRGFSTIKKTRSISPLPTPHNAPTLHTRPTRQASTARPRFTAKAAALANASRRIALSAGAPTLSPRGALPAPHAQAARPCSRLAAQRRGPRSAACRAPASAPPRAPVSPRAIPHIGPVAKFGTTDARLCAARKHRRAEPLRGPATHFRDERLADRHFRTASGPREARVCQEKQRGEGARLVTDRCRARGGAGTGGAAARARGGAAASARARAGASLTNESTRLGLTSRRSPELPARP